MTMNASGKKNISKASHVVRAPEQLEKAVTRLDQVISARSESSSNAENTQMAEEMAALKAENTKLQESARAISGRLDQAIDKLKTVLES